MNAKILTQGEKIFLPIDETIDKKCYEINNIENWANCFYNLKSGIILERYKQIISRTENNKFFEALNYEYGINNYPLDKNKALQIYKTAADTSSDTLSMFRLYRIYKTDYKKFNIKKRNFVLEKFYILKCYSYLTSIEKNTLLYSRFDISTELSVQLKDEKAKFYKWYSEFMKFLFKNNKIYNINKDDIFLIDVVINLNFSYDIYYFNDKKLKKLADDDHPEVIYNLASVKVVDKKLYLEKLKEMNYYKSACDYAKIMDNGKEALLFVKKSLMNGYYSYIKCYMEIFFKINEFEEIFKQPILKSELQFIFGCMIDAIIADEIEIFIYYINIRKISIKHFNFADEFKFNFDIYTKEIINYLMNFTKGTDEENKKITKLYYINDYFFREIYTKFAVMYYYGVSGLIRPNLKEALNKFNLIHENYILEEKNSYYFIYKIKLKERKVLKFSRKKTDSNNNENINKEEKDLIELEKKLIKMYYEDFTPEKIKKFPPSFFYILSKLYSSSSINNQDIIFEYVLLNRASNAPLLNVENIDYYYYYFKEKYLKYKAKKKLEEINKEENFSKLKEAKGIINVEGYGEDGIICPICFENQKSAICLPCKHFFCGTCLKKLLKKGVCPICRTDIKITFDINLRKENLIQSILSNSFIY